MNRVKTCWHEAGHALTARRLGRKIELVSVSPTGGGHVLEEPFAPNGTEDEIKQSLVVTFAGLVAGEIAPRELERSEGNGHFSVSELEAMTQQHELDKTAPSDEDVIRHYAGRVDAQVVEDAHRLAREFVARDQVLGRLERVADALLLHGQLSGEDLEVLCAPPH